MKKLLKILACPVCKGSIEFDNTQKELVCTSCSMRYDVQDNVPIMLDDECKRELNSYLNSKAGQQMVSEYDNKSLFTKLYKLGMKITGGSNFHLPVKERLDKVIAKGGDDGIILEIGSGSHRLDKKIINVDISPFSNVDVVSNGAKLSFQDNSVDGIFLLAVLEHTREPNAVIKECFRVLKKGGIIYAEAPFIFRYHSYPTDFWRYSVQGMEELFRQFKKQETGMCVGPSSGLLTFLTHYVTLFSFSDNHIINTCLKALTFYFLFPLKYLDLLLAKNKRSHELAAGVYFMGEKE